jgi:hypothetical protein
VRTSNPTTKKMLRMTSKKMEKLFYNIRNRPDRSNEENGDENNTIKKNMNLEMSIL